MGKKVDSAITMMHDKRITINDSEIRINSTLFIMKDHTFIDREIILDHFSYYKEQEIVIELFDGDNLYWSGFLDFILRLMDAMSIERKKLFFFNRDPKAIHELANTDVEMGIFANACQYINADDYKIPQGVATIGALLGRFSLTRLRAAYEMDKTFPNDNYLIFQPNIDHVRQKTLFVNGASDMTEWLSKKILQTDIKVKDPTGRLDKETSYKTYVRTAGNYRIELVCETEVLNNHWFTEKTARVLAIGKPFLLISGKGSLARLRAWGFKTMSPVLDEDYDNLFHPAQRITSALLALRSLDQSQLSEIEQLAFENKRIYQCFSQKHHNKFPNKYPYEDQ